MRTPLLLLGLLLLLAATPPLAAQGLDDIVGTWIGVSEDVQGDRVQIAKDHIVIDGDKYPLRFVRKGELVIGPANDQAKLNYELKGDRLHVTFFEEKSIWRRDGQKPGGTPGKTPQEPQGGNPLGGNPLGGSGRNPLGGPPPKPVDPFVRRFEGDGLVLVLEAPDGDAYRGKLTFRGATYPVEAKRKDKSLSGSFRVGGDAFALRGTLKGDDLTLASGGKTYRLKGEKLKPAGPVNPLGGGSGSTGTSGPPAGTKVFVHAGANAACYVPNDWTIQHQTGQVVVLNPGFAQGSRLDATVTLMCPKLPAEQQVPSVDKFLQAELPSLRQSLKANGVETGEPTKPIQEFKVRGLPAAFVKMSARTQTGLSGTTWIAVALDGHQVFVCNAIFLNETEARLLPKVEQLFGSLRTADKADELRKGVRERGTEGPGRENEESSDEPGPGKQALLLLQKKELRDPGFGGIVSHTMLLPKGWEGELGVRWTPGASNYLHFVGGFRAPAGHGFHFDYNRSYRHSTSPELLARYQQEVAATRSRYFRGRSAT